MYLVVLDELSSDGQKTADHKFTFLVFVLPLFNLPSLKLLPQQRIVLIRVSLFRTNYHNHQRICVGEFEPRRRIRWSASLLALSILQKSLIIKLI